MSFINLFLLLIISISFAQEPFLEIKPFQPPSFEQYPSSGHVDHHHPYSNNTDNLFLRFDGTEFFDDVLYPDCIYGSSCYDGHAGTDFFMPFNTPILSPANGYVLWASFSTPADPCPGGITPNGDQGTIILAHGNDYFTIYLHMTPPLNVSVGENVETGDTLGFAGNTGCALNTHLHFEIRKGSWFFDSSEPYAVDPFGWWSESLDPIEEFHGNRSEWLWVSNSLVDDGDNGFQRFQGPDWIRQSQGFNNDFWTSPSITEPSESKHHAMWVPYVESAGEYDIEAFIPSGDNHTTGAIYELYIKNDDGTSNQVQSVVDQSSAEGDFILINTMSLPAGAKFAIILRDLVSEGASGSNVVYDAIRINPLTSNIDTLVNEKKIIENINLYDAYPNPFNSNVMIKYQIEKTANITIRLINLEGKTLFKQDIKNKSAGAYTFKWNGKSETGEKYPSGVYIFSILSNSTSKSKKFAYLK